MGFPHSTHIRKFVHGQTIADLQYNAETGSTLIVFEGGEILQIYPHYQQGKLSIIATPYDQGRLVQSKEIMER